MHYIDRRRTLVHFLWDHTDSKTQSYKKKQDEFFCWCFYQVFIVSRFSISTALVQSKSSSGKKKKTNSFPWEPSYFYLPQQPSYSTLSFQFSHIFSLCIRSMIQWNLISSAHCHKLLSGTKLSLKFNLKQNEKEKNHKWKSGPQPILWAPFSQGLQVILLHQVNLNYGQVLLLLLLPNEKASIKTRPPSRHIRVSVLIVYLAKMHFLILSDFQMKYKQLKFYHSNKWGHRLSHI